MFWDADLCCQYMSKFVLSTKVLHKKSYLANSSQGWCIRLHCVKENDRTKQTDCLGP